MNDAGDNISKDNMPTDHPLIDLTDPFTVPNWKSTPGTIGIFNHGNSCFMNAVLQCLSNTDSFTEYFVKEFYKNDLKNNRNHRKGKQVEYGEVTEQLGKLLMSLWCGNYKSDFSKDFKIVVGKCNDQYKGDQQHDALEFLLWLLDRLHEDLCLPSNRKKIKLTKVSFC